MAPGRAALSSLAVFFVLAAGCGGDDGPSGTDGGGGGADAGARDGGGGGDDAGGGMPCDDDEACDDGLFCNGAEACTAGRCAGGVAPSCDDGADCTTDACDESARECTHEAPDADGDGHAPEACGGDDCDDDDMLRFIGADEVCDPADRDEDCDPTTFGVRDADGDSYADAACCNGDLCGTDCDDTAGAVHPTAPELCSNDLDDDCDGMVNDGCECRDGETRPCAMAMGECAAGVETCAGGGWSSCSITPIAEICDGRDEDCDGTADDGTTIDCYADGDDDGWAPAGAVAMPSCPASGGADRCDTNLTSRAPVGADIDCEDGFALIHPTATETCNHVDQDCDGRIDEGATVTVFTDSDRDLFGDAATGRPGCMGDPGTSTTSTDCNDRYATVRPSQTEYQRAGYCNGPADECTTASGVPGCWAGAPPIVSCEPALRRWDYDCDGMDEREPISASPCIGLCGMISSCRGGGITDVGTPPCGGAASQVRCSCAGTCTGSSTSVPLACL